MQTAQCKYPPQLNETYGRTYLMMMDGLENWEISKLLGLTERAVVQRRWKVCCLMDMPERNLFAWHYKVWLPSLEGGK